MCCDVFLHVSCVWCSFSFVEQWFYSLYQIWIFSDIIQFLNLRHCSTHLLKMDWVFFIFFVFLLHMFNLPSSFLNILNTVLMALKPVLVSLSASSLYHFQSIFLIKDSIFLLICMLLDARNCEFYLVGCWIFCYSYLCIHILCSERLRYFAKITYPFDACFQALLLWTRKTFNLH